MQAHTPVETISDRAEDGWINVKTDRGSIRTRAVVHATNAFASHLLPEFEKLIKPEISTLAAISAPSRYIKHTGAQHWDSTVNVSHSLRGFETQFTDRRQNYHLQLPRPHNAIILGGGRQFLVHRPDQCFLSARDDEQILGIAQFFESWPASDVVGGSASIPAKLAMPENQGGYWTGGESDYDDFLLAVTDSMKQSKPRVPTRFRSLELYRVEKGILLLRALLGMVRFSFCKQGYGVTIY